MIEQQINRAAKPQIKGEKEEEKILPQSTQSTQRANAEKI